MFYTLHPAATSKGPNSQIREFEPFQGETRPQLWGWHILTSSPNDWVKETPKKNCRAWSSIGSKHHQSAEYLALKRVSILSMGSIMCVGVTTNLALTVFLDTLLFSSRCTALLGMDECRVCLSKSQRILWMEPPLFPNSQQPASPIGFLFLKLPPPPCAVLLVYIFIYVYNISILFDQGTCPL